MPIYEFRCVECNQTTESIQRLNDPPPGVCPSCGGELKKLLSAPSFQFKGTGWYVTDYAKKGEAPESKKSDGGEGKTESKSDSTAATKETKSKETSKATSGDGG